MLQAMKYLSLFLPTTSSIPPEKAWKLWLEEFFTLWSSFSNSPSWETELFSLYTRLAFHNTGRIDWTPYVEQLFTKFMVAFCLPVTYGQSGVKVKFGLSESGSFAYISRWIVSALGGNAHLSLGGLLIFICVISRTFFSFENFLIQNLSSKKCE